MEDFDSMTLAEAAICYAENCYAVLPLLPRDKKPRCEHGSHDASADPEVVRAWWERWPDSNIGLACGGMLVVDIDPRNGGPADRGEFIERFGPIPETAEAITGGGGRHILFRYAGCPVPKQLAEGIDLKAGEGAYIVVAPSIHPTGGRYTWDGDGFSKLAETPARILDAMSKIQSSHNQHKRETDGGKILEGQRNNALVRVAGALQRIGTSAESILAALLAENHRCCVPELAEAEIRSIVASVMRYPSVDTDGRAQALDVSTGIVGTGGGHPGAESNRHSFAQKWASFTCENQGGKVQQIENVVQTFQRWLYLPDPGLVHVALAAMAANLLPGSPLWLLLVGAPASGKTEILNSLRMLPGLHPVATLTEGSLLSGTSKRDRTKDATGGLLRQIGDFGIIIAKDFTSVLSMHPEARCAVLAALREVFDGEWTRLVGTDGGRELHWKGKVGFIGGVTPVLDQHQGVMAAMGERFIYYRLPSADPEQQALRAIENSGRSREIARELADSVAQLFRGVALQRLERNSMADAARFVYLATLTAHSRSAVIRDGRTREVELVPESEMPARLAQTLISLDDGLAAIGTNPAERWRLVCKVALDSLPALRRRALFAAIESNVGLSAAEFAIRVQHPTTTVKRALEDLAAHGVLRRRRDRSADTWEATAKTRSRWQGAGLVVPAELEDVSTEGLSIVVEAA